MLVEIRSSPEYFERPKSAAPCLHLNIVCFVPAETPDTLLISERCRPNVFSNTWNTPPSLQPFRNGISWAVFGVCILSFVSYLRQRSAALRTRLTTRCRIGRDLILPLFDIDGTWKPLEVPVPIEIPPLLPLFPQTLSSYPLLLSIDMFHCPSFPHSHGQWISNLIPDYCSRCWASH